LILSFFGATMYMEYNNLKGMFYFAFSICEIIS
jgi:hypothetical protein